MCGYGCKRGRVGGLLDVARLLWCLKHGMLPGRGSVGQGINAFLFFGASTAPRESGVWPPYKIRSLILFGNGKE